MLIAPNRILQDLLRKRELILACARREFHASYYETLVGALWPVLNPLIMLAIFKLVFGYTFGGKFSQSADKTRPSIEVSLKNAALTANFAIKRTHCPFQHLVRKLLQKALMRGVTHALP
jgi:hypothetical protein